MSLKDYRCIIKIISKSDPHTIVILQNYYQITVTILSTYYNNTFSTLVEYNQLTMKIQPTDCQQTY